VQQFLASVHDQHDGFAIYLVGSSREFYRHIQEKIMLGIAEEFHIVVERDYKTYMALVAEGRRLGFRGMIWHGDFFNVTELVARKNKIAHLDFDGVNSFNYDGNAEHFFWLVLRFGVLSYIYVYCPRMHLDTNTDRLAKQLKIAKTVRSHSNGKADRRNFPLHYANKDLVESFVSQILPAPWIHSKATGYMGKCQMGFITGRREAVCQS